MKSRILLPIGLLGFATATGWSAVIYSSNPDFTVSANTNLSDAKWYGAAGRSDFYSIVNVDGTPANPPNNTNRKAGIFNGNDGSGTLNDYLFFQNANTTSTTIDYFAHTATGSSFVSFAPQNYAALTASWLTNRDGFATGGGYFVAVQVSGAWYASTTNAASQTALGSVSVDLLASGWVAITEDQDPGNGGTDGSILLGTSTFTYANLFGAGQSITGVGFYVDSLSATSGGARNLRIDNFSIQDVVPEPSSVLSGLLGAGLLALRRRR